MPCYCPIVGYYARDLNPSGKRGIVFKKADALSGAVVKLPCGQCVGCRLERSRQWAMRCIHEKSMHKESMFVTLTYDDKHLPKDGTLVKADMSAFCKRLHNRLLRRRGYGIRFYGCGEYGERSGRPHYHILIFGYSFPDKKAVRSRGEFPLFTSRECASLWTKGFNVIGDVDFDSAAYVARYIMKKVTGPLAENYYSWADADGVIHEITPEFTNMSRRPGIGYDWFRVYGAHSYRHDSVVVKGREVRPPRYYDTKYDVVDRMRLDALKKMRRSKAMRHRADQTPERRRVSEVVASARLTLGRREI